MADYTEHYQLHQWQPEDPFLRTDFNADLQKIDTALGELMQTDKVLEDRIEKCQLFTCSYVGTGNHGEENACSLVFPIKPILMVIVGHFATAIFVAGSDSLIALCNGDTISNNITCSEDGKTLTWHTYASDNGQMNYSGWKYQVAALGAT